MNQKQTAAELNPLAFTHNGVEVRHVRKDSNDAHSRITNYWYKIGNGIEETDVRRLPGYKEPVYCAADEMGEYPRKIAEEVRRVICLYIDSLPAPEPNPAVPAADTVETLLAFIEANASEEVFEKAQQLEMVLSLAKQGAESDAKEWETKYADLKEELADGDTLAGYAEALKGLQLEYFAGSLLENPDFAAAVRKEWADDMKQDGTEYLAIPATFDHFDGMAAGELTALITRLGIAHSLRLLTGTVQ